MTDFQKSPISTRVSVLRLPGKGMPVQIEADEMRREQLAREHDLLSVEDLRADLVVETWKRDGVKVSGEVFARIRQACIVTLDPVESEIRERVEAVFIPEHSSLARHSSDPSGEIFVDPEGPDAPDLFSGDTIDVGALAEEFFGLAIDPYPRSAAAAGQAVHGDKSFRDGSESPFAKLHALKTKL